MDIRQAILAAADHIGQNPKDFHFTAVRFPVRCGAPGCALGWIGHFYGVDRIKPRDETFSGNILAVTDLLGIPSYNHEECTFYARLDEFNMYWRANATGCAQALRQYADKYHPEVLPDWQALAARLADCELPAIEMTGE
jgi:hypothetical protein